MRLSGHNDRRAVMRLLRRTILFRELTLTIAPARGAAA
jgi:hypothetical protein